MAIITAIIGILGIFLGAWINNVFTWKIKDKIDALDMLSKKLLGINQPFKEFLDQVWLWNEKRKKLIINNGIFKIFNNGCIYIKTSESGFRQMINKPDGIYKVDELSGDRYYIVQNKSELNDKYISFSRIPINPSSRRKDRLDKLQNESKLNYNDIIGLFPDYNQEDFDMDYVTIQQKLKQMRHDIWQKINELYFYNMLLNKKFTKMIKDYQVIRDDLTTNMTIDISNGTSGLIDYKVNCFILNLDDSEFKKQVGNTDGVYKTTDGNYYQVFDGRIIVKLELVDNTQHIFKFKDNSKLEVSKIEKLFSNYEKKTLYERFNSNGNNNNDGIKKHEETFYTLLNGLISYREDLTSFSYMSSQLFRIKHLMQIFEK